MRYSAVILAAGKSSRYGKPKQLLEMNGSTLLTKACRLAIDSGCSPVVLVLGAHSEKILASEIPEEVTIVIHDAWEEGMGSSISKGVSELERIKKSSTGTQPSAMLLLLVDQPGVKADTVTRMYDLYESKERAGVSIVLCKYMGQQGPPAIFSEEHVEELTRLEGDVGARTLVKKHPGSVRFLNAEEAGWDIDTPERWDTFLSNELGDAGA